MARQIKIRNAKGLCERCGKPGKEVHQVIRLNTANVIALNPKNLEFLCKGCDNKEHKRFS